MNIYRHSDNIPFDASTAITVGTFDGVHCGHRSIIDRMKDVAAANGERTVVVTFDPHPQIVLAKADRAPIRLLTGIEQRLELLEEAGVDVAVVIAFSHEFAATPPSEFVVDGLVRKIGVRHFFIGHDHMFGKDREGNVELLQRLATEYGFAVERIAPLDSNGVVVSSTVIRKALATGDVEGAAAMLGRPYAVRGMVVRGDQRGSKLGIPTANMSPTNEVQLLPGHGVYVVSSVINGMPVIGMANIGRRPTFTNDDRTTLEVHYLEFDGMLYDQTVDVAFHRFIRPEMKFESVDMFLSQIREDRAVAAEFSESNSHTTIRSSEKS